ncbi:MAG: BrnA antitoxin family protein [Oscillospiraceae bacterium]|nr:BrnA antitoxin family protein [Oscillospiraceae bacterium]
MIITREIDLNEELTEEQLKMLEAAENSPVITDEDAPDISDEQLARMSQLIRERRSRDTAKQTVAIRISPKALATARSLGKGYTSVLSRILESTLADREKLKNYL